MYTLESEPVYRSDMKAMTSFQYSYLYCIMHESSKDNAANTEILAEMPSVEG